MIFYIGPVTIGFLLGFILGTRVQISSQSKLKFDTEVYVIVLIAAIIVAYYLGPFPYYEDVPLASGFVSAIIGLIIGKLLFGRDKGAKSQIDWIKNIYLNVIKSGKYKFRFIKGV